MEGLQFSEKAKSIKPGIYEHFKGARYKVLRIVRHSETLEEMVVYKHMFGDNSTWVRPIDMFLEEVERDGKKIPRFKYISEN